MSKRKPTHFSRLNLQTLESRENPAGVISASITNGILTITGGDESSDITVDFSGTIKFVANDSETVPADLPIPTGGLKGININLAGGNDIIRTAANSSINVGAGQINIDLGSGSNAVDWNSLTTITSGPINYKSGDGADTFGITMAQASTVSGGLKINAGNGQFNLSLGSAVADGLNITGGINITDTFGDSNILLTKLKTTTFSLIGNDSTAFLTPTTFQSVESNFSGLINLALGNANTSVSVAGGQINGLKVTSKNSVIATINDINFVNSVALPTGDITLNAKGHAALSIDLTNVTDAKLGNLSALGDFHGLVEIDGGTLQPNQSKTVGNISVKSGSLNDAEVNLNDLSSVGTITANSTGTGQDATIRLLNVGKTRALKATAYDFAGVDVTTATEVGDVTLTACETNLGLQSVGKVGKVNVSAVRDTFVSLNTINEVGSLTIRGNLSSQLNLDNILKSAGVTVSSPSGDASLFMGGVITGVTATKSGGNVSVTGLSAIVEADTGTSVVNGNVTVKGSRFDSGVVVSKANTNLTVQGTTNVTGGLEVTLASDSGSGDFIANGNVSLTQTDSRGDLVMDLSGNKATFAKNLTVKVAGSSRNQFATVAQSEVVGDYNFTGGVFDDQFTISEQFKAKNIKWDTKNGKSTILIGSKSAAQIPISGNLTITTGTGDDSIGLQGVTVTGKTTIQTGAYLDRISIDNSTFTGESKIDTGAGEDILEIGSQLGAAKKTEITSVATYLLGLGNDTLTLGLKVANGGDVNTNVAFGSIKSKIDGGKGVDKFNDNPDTTLAISPINF